MRVPLGCLRRDPSVGYGESAIALKRSRAGLYTRHPESRSTRLSRHSSRGHALVTLRGAVLMYLLPMRNPADELAEMLVEWEIPVNTQPLYHRQNVAREKGSTLHAEMRRATDCLSRIEQELTRLRARGANTEDFDSALLRWSNSVYSIDEDWSVVHRQGTRPVVSAGDLRLLRALALAIDLAGGATQLAPETLQAVEQTIRDAEKFVRSAPGITESFRLHLLGLLAAIREAVANGSADRVGPLVAEFVGTASLAAERVPEAEREGWRSMARDWVLQFSANVAAAGAVPLIASSATALGLG